MTKVDYKFITHADDHKQHVKVYDTNSQVVYVDPTTNTTVMVQERLFYMEGS